MLVLTTTSITKKMLIPIMTSAIIHTMIVHTLYIGGVWEERAQCCWLEKNYVFAHNCCYNSYMELAMSTGSSWQGSWRDQCIQPICERVVVDCSGWPAV